MKFFRIDLLTLLISLFILSSCKNQDGIGLDPDQKLNGTLLVDDNIAVNTIPEDTIITSQTATNTKTPLGYFNDPQMGTTEANIAAALNLPSLSAYTLPTGTVTIDSAVLVLRYADGFYGDSLTSKYKINVYQLDEKISPLQNYYNNKAWKYKNSTLLGTQLFNSRTHTSFKVTDIVKGAKDTLLVVPPQVRVPISPTFINSILFAAPSDQLASNAVFLDRVKGLYFTMDKTQSTGAGGNFMVAIDSSNVSVYYHTDNAGTLDTAVVTMPFSARAAEIKHTYTASVQAAINQTSSNSTFYIQGLGGLKAKISFPGLKDIISQAGSDIVINRAELVITPSAGTTIPFKGQAKLNMYRLDIAKQRILLQDASAADRRFQSLSIFGGDLSPNNDYHFIITGYIQDLMLDRSIDYGTYLEAVDNTVLTPSASYQQSSPTAGRLVAAGSVTNQSAADYPYRIKLNLIYTKVNK